MSDPGNQDNRGSGQDLMLGNPAALCFEQKPESAQLNKKSQTFFFVSFFFQTYLVQGLPDLHIIP